MRVLFGLLATAVVAMSGQSPVSIKAGDPAPNLVWTRILHSADPAAPEPGSFFGRVTVLVFSPNVSADPHGISRWNELVAKFAEQPVAFVMITSEREEKLAAWLPDHAVSGWLLLDENRDSARAYGMELPGGVVIDRNGKVAGFTFHPDEREVRAVLEDRAVTIPDDADGAHMETTLASGAVRLDAEPHRLPTKPDIPPSYEVHISPATKRGTFISDGPDYFEHRGFRLRQVISDLWGKDANRVVLPASLDNEDRYDCVVALPHEMQQEAMHRLVQQAIERHFRVSVTAEIRPVEVYVMTVEEGKAPAKSADDGGGGFEGVRWAIWDIAVDPQARTEKPRNYEMIREMMATAPVSEMSAMDITMERFCSILEERLNRPVMDETSLKGSYDIAVSGIAGTNEDLFRKLREQSGIVVTPAQRNVEVVVVRQLP